MASAQNTITFATLTSIVLSIVIGLASAFVINRRVGSPIRESIGVMADMQAGNYAVKVAYAERQDWIEAGAYHDAERSGTTVIGRSGLFDMLAAAEAARVPLKFLLGHSQRWGKPDVAEPNSLSAYLASDERANSGVSDHAEVMLLSPLGLGWTHAGRSRVGFLRAMGVESMAARVTALPYPAPEQLALYQVSNGGLTQFWCVMDKRRLRALPVPALSLPLLTAYGVAAPQAWPSNWPAPAEVDAALALARMGKGAAEVDLVKLVDKIGRDQANDAWTGASLMQLHTWVPRWRFFLTSFIGLPAGLLLLAALALPGRVEAAAVAAALGFAGGAIAALAAPWIYARRKHLS